MRRRPYRLIGAVLPLAALAFWHAYRGGAEETPTVAAPTPPPVAAATPAAVNAAPTLALEAIDEGKVGQMFDLQPEAKDAERDSLHFTALNLPAWASLDPSSGRISGIPGANDVGTYESITIKVADATHEVLSAPFSISVVQGSETGTGVASLQWQMPMSKVSGEPLDDLAGYRILYGRNRDDLDQSVLVTDPTMTSYQFSTLAPGTWYFAVVAVSQSGLEGPPTMITTKSI